MKTEKSQLLPLKIAVVLLCLMLTALAVMWTGVNVHPADALSGGSASPVSIDLSAKMDVFANNTASTVLDGLTYIPKIYRIDNDALSGPKPNMDCYGETDDPALLLEAISGAEELLSGQTLVWNPELTLRPGSDLRWYLDDTILAISWQEVRNNCVYNFSEIKIAHPSQFRRMLAGNSFGASQQLPCSEMAASANAVVASNADFYGFRPYGINVYQGTLYRCAGKFVDTCFIDKNGDLIFSRAGELPTEEEVNAFIREKGIEFSISFGPIEVENGKAITSISYPIGEVNDIYARSSIGQLGELHYLLMTAGSAGNYSNSATVLDAAAMMADKGCDKAYALDGGQTAEMIFCGKIRNRIVYDSERHVSDIIYFATAIPEKEG